eukprot:TRINITY_DN12886_c2_g1_i1.p2 TRINITY_DN12886_c2_g1~~TRINITY_DN12886_c2_g1_i1.p2  ORF type:complete len:122 (+),score=1.24 TRINITY_DN12886_c2_g1_i1:280-645(+)
MQRQQNYSNININKLLYIYFVSNKYKIKLHLWTEKCVAYSLSFSTSPSSERNQALLRFSNWISHNMFFAYNEGLAWDVCRLSPPLNRLISLDAQLALICRFSKGTGCEGQRVIRTLILHHS